MQAGAHMNRDYPLHIHISTLFLVVIVIIGGLIGGVGYKLSSDTLTSAADDLARRISHETGNDLVNLIKPAEMATSLLRHDAITKAGTYEERRRRLHVLTDALAKSPAVVSIYVGYRTGDFFLVRRIENDRDRERFSAPPATAFVVQSIERNARPQRGRFVFLDAALRTIGEDERPAYVHSFDPRTRDWYREAVESGKLIRTAPYVFFTSQVIGTTLAMADEEGAAAIGADIRFETIGKNLERQKITPGTHVLIANQQGLTLAHEDMNRLVHVGDDGSGKTRLKHLSELGIPVIAQAGALLPRIPDSGQLSERLQTTSDTWNITIRPVVLESGKPFFLIMAIPESELLASAIKLRQTSILITLLIILIALPVTWLVARAIARPLRMLEREADAIRNFDFSTPIATRSLVHEVNALSHTMDEMKRTIRHFLDINSSLANEENFERLLPMLLRESLQAARADSGVLFLADEERLIPSAAVRGDGLPLSHGSDPLPIGQAPALLQAAIRAGEPMAGALSESDAVAPLITSTDGEGTPRFGIGIPLLNRQRQLVGAMLLFLDEQPGAALVSFARALSGAMASSLETRELIKAQKELFESFVQLIAVAIDAKSPYTGGHCARVPELSKMLARAACEATAGPFRDFQLSDDEWETLHVAAWLHDCGKVTTPEYVVDKATKLETIYDRIHEVRMRFEVLKRDAEIAALKEVAAGADPVATTLALNETLCKLDDDFAFVAACNEGGEFLAKDNADRLRAIAELRWRRTLDDRIGISHEEKERKSRTPAAALPVMEPLLADRPEHRILRTDKERIADDNPWGFRMKVPELLYNRGELYNLLVERGTLSEEERYKINEHIVQTVIMLSRLPFPKHLRQIPEIAGGHHEKMDGTGYPKRLTRDELSPVARMMAIADIFEALTAVDRPYKKGKTLSEAIRVMSFMKKDGHIDPDLFELFLQSGVYRRYAEAFMKPEQIDDVDIGQYLNKMPA